MLNIYSYLNPLVAAGWLSELDVALGEFVAEREVENKQSLGLVAAVLSQELSAQHVCLSLDALLHKVNEGLTLLHQSPLTLAALGVMLDKARCIASADGGQLSVDKPLVKEGQDLYLQRYWQYETRLAAAILALSKETLVVDPSACRALLLGLFPPSEGIDWQKVAVLLAISRRFCVITGGPGTGKTTTVTRLMALVQGLAKAQGKPLRIALAAPTGKAAARLSESIGAAKAKLPTELSADIPEQAQTLHRLLGVIPNSVHFRHNSDNPLALDMLILDEASMVDLPLMAKLFVALPSHARLVMLGDRQQLASVEVGTVLADICQSLGEPFAQSSLGQFSQQTCKLIKDLGGPDLPACDTAQSRLQDNVVMLTHSHRFGADSGIGKLAMLTNSGDSQGLNAFLQQPSEDVLWQAKPRQSHLLDILCQSLQDYFKAIDNGDIREAFACLARQQVLCATRKGPWGTEQLNAQVQLALTQRGWIRPQQDFYPGRPLMVSQNDYRVRLFNGDIGICMADREGMLKVWFMDSQGELKGLLPSRVPPHQTLYAMTIHKSQGSEFEHAILALGEQSNELLSRELLYTGITRAKKQVSLYASSQVLNQAVQRRCMRGSGLASRLGESVRYEG
ncbi:exodeoxyribonuclease V subunit alpha [Aliiglaciecola sp. CAU 1673]|uniref:exodeoxyribonuclease V subunit alpha n=1 Tax=Aliiglaciecola sp. CAU 1673 TaxID=3032595 RepID=UPI0023DB9C84|nr:exodeoxyribonuclease V subunit alpha [Aliiglaciecola sp. CAU 1673]MDF2179813.1 exodeoxyribonuclease V subunit alpha [Aliiglaciecola sp. CAU 1673]